MHRLTQLRKQYVDASLKIAALTESQEARKDEANTVRRELEAAALANDTDKTRELMDDLAAINKTFLKVQEERNAAAVEMDYAYENIEAYYNAAYNGGPAKVDWSVELRHKERCLYSQWYQRSKDGDVCVTHTELCKAEIDVMQKTAFRGYRIGLHVSIGGYRLHVKEAVYRDICWDDIDGQRIIAEIVPLLEVGEAAKEAQDFIKSLPVLAER